jgi:hypothetical protein
MQKLKLSCMKAKTNRNKLSTNLKKKVEDLILFEKGQ